MTSTILQNSPAFILASYIIAEGIGSMSLPANNLAWPLYVSYMPDASDVKTDCGALYDKAGVKDGRLMSGEVIPHHGIELKIRSDTYTDGWAKAEAIATALDAVLSDTVVVSAVTFQFDNIGREETINPIGTEKGTKKRHLFTVNFFVTLKRIT